MDVRDPEAVKAAVDQLEQALESPRNISELRALMANYSQDQIMEALRILIDDRKVIESNGKFSLT